MSLLTYLYEISSVLRDWPVVKFHDFSVSDDLSSIPLPGPMVALVGLNKKAQLSLTNPLDA